MSSFLFCVSGSLFSLLFSADGGDGGAVSSAAAENGGSGVGSESRRALGRGSESSWAFRLVFGVFGPAAGGGGRADEGAEKLQKPNSAM